jgi:hypothetical protein
MIKLGISFGPTQFEGMLSKKSENVNGAWYVTTAGEIKIEENDLQRLQQYIADESYFQKC